MSRCFDYAPKRRRFGALLFAVNFPHYRDSGPQFISFLTRLGFLHQRATMVCTKSGYLSIWTFHRKSTPLLPWKPRNQEFRPLPYSARSYHPLRAGGSSRDDRFSHNFDRVYRPPGPPPSGVHDLLYQIPCSPEPDNFLENGAFEYAMSQEAAKYVKGSLVSLSFYEGGELLKEFSGSGFVIRSDGIIATSANLLRPLQGKECEIIVKFSNFSGSYKGALLHADFCSNIALIKIMSGQRLAVATFGKLDSMCPGKWVTVAGSKPPDYMWSDSVFNFDLGNFSHLDHVDNKTDSTESQNARTSGQLIKADCKSRRTSIGGALVSINGVIFGEGGINYGVIGVVHTVSGPLIEATPIDEVLKYLEQFENNREQAQDIVHA